MSYHDNERIVDALFVGATRPTTIYGVTYEAALLYGFALGVLFVLTKNVFFVLLGVPVCHTICFLLSRAEPRIFTLLAKKAKLYGTQRNLKFWGCSSYSPFENDRYR